MGPWAAYCPSIRSDLDATAVGYLPIDLLCRHGALPRCERPPGSGRSRYRGVVWDRAPRLVGVGHGPRPLAAVRGRSMGLLVRSPADLALGFRLRLLRRLQPPRLESHQSLGRWLDFRPLAVRCVQCSGRRSPLGAPSEALPLTREPRGPTGFWHTPRWDTWSARWNAGMVRVPGQRLPLAQRRKPRIGALRRRCHRHQTVRRAAA